MPASPPPPGGTTALRTDHYELTMVDAALRDGRGDRRCVFEVFARSLPEGRRYGVVAGLERVVDAVLRFRFDDDALDWLDHRGFLHPDTLAHLAGYRFAGDITGYREGELYFADSPVLTVEASFVDAVVLETVVLSILNHDSAIASAAARMVQAAGDRPLMEFGGRRTHEDAAVAAARAAYLVGFGGTSNLEAGRRHGVPTLGTSAHAYTLVHDREEEAFAGQVAAHGKGTTLLVDTFDTTEGVANAIAAGGPGLDAIRLDSGDLAAEARRARAQLDAAGLRDTRIVASGDLDEYRLAELRDAPIDAYGVGTSVVTGSGHPTAGFVYKLVARASDDGDGLVPVAKTSTGKPTAGGRKRAVRELRDGTAVAERVVAGEPPGLEALGRPLQVPVVTAGEVVHRPGPDDVRAHHRAAVAELPAGATDPGSGAPALPTHRTLPRLQEETR